MIAMVMLRLGLGLVDRLGGTGVVGGRRRVGTVALDGAAQEAVDQRSGPLRAAREGFRKAYSGFSVDKVARYGEKDRARLLADPGIIRNRLKVDAAIHNAQVIRDLRSSHGGFLAWLEAHHPLTKPEWVKLFKKTFRFTGGEITGEFLMSLGYLSGAHREDCPAFKRAAKAKPAWMRKTA